MAFSAGKAQYCFSEGNLPRLTVSGRAHHRTLAVLLMAVAVAMCGGLTAILASSAYAYDKPVASNNEWENEYWAGSWAGRWSHVSQSALTVDSSGNLQRVEYIDGKGLVVETYTTGGSFVSGKTIDASTYEPSDLKSEKNFLWGGVFCGESYNFVVTGQNNPNEDNDLGVLVITRYSKDWESDLQLVCRHINTYIPFDAGSCAMAESNGQLMVRTCHEMYQTSDGYHHQASMSFVLDESSMVPQAYHVGIMNISQTSLGYVSHSFDQHLAVLDGRFYSLDLGDADETRCAVVKKLGYTGSSSYASVKSIAGESGDNTTYTTTGGLAASPVTGTLLAVGTQRDQSKAYEASDYTKYPRNVWLTIVNSSNLSTKQLSLTSYAEDSKTDAGNPQIIKVADNEFLIMWGVRRGSQQQTVNYLFVDGDGNVVKSMRSFKGALSDCQPIVDNGKVYWYVTGADSEEQPPTIYAMNIATGDVATTKTWGDSTPDSPNTPTAVSSVTLNTATISAKSLAVAAAKAGASSKSLKIVYLGTKVKSVKAKTFAGFPKVGKLIVKTKKLTKASVKNALKASKVKTVQVKVGSAATNASYVKKYKKFFAKSNSGRSVAVK